MLLGNIINGDEDVEIRRATAAATAAAAMLLLYQDVASFELLCKHFQHLSSGTLKFCSSDMNPAVLHTSL